MEILFILITAAILGIFPAYLAKKKGYSFGLWWLYGWMLFIVAIIHVQFIDDISLQKEKQETVPIKTIKDMDKQKQLLEKGEITQQEYNKRKNQLLGL